MVLSKEERIELLAKARQKKAELNAAKNETDDVKNEIQTKTKGKKTKTKETKTLDLTSIEDVNKKEENEILVKNEVIKIIGPKKKRIIKRVIEVEEPSTDEEIEEEVVMIPKKKKEVIKSDVREINSQRPTQQNDINRRNEINTSIYKSIFPY